MPGIANSGQVVYKRFFENYTVLDSVRLVASLCYCSLLPIFQKEKLLLLSSLNTYSRSLEGTAWKNCKLVLFAVIIVSIGTGSCCFI